MGRPRKFKTPKELGRAWDEFKNYCDNREVLTHEFSAKNSEFVSEKLTRSVTYTIEGFCVWVKLARKAFYDTYDGDSKFTHIVTLIREECEVDARTKFELGMISDRLAGLWMSKYGYTTRTDMFASQNVETPKIMEVFGEMQGKPQMA